MCDCIERPFCELPCDQPARWSVRQPKWGERRERYVFMCQGHYEVYRDAWMKPIRGIDRPEGAGEDWRASLDDMMRHASIARSFERRNDRPAPAPEEARRHTPAQLQQLGVLRRHIAAALPNGERQ